MGITAGNLTKLRATHTKLVGLFSWRANYGQVSLSCSWDVSNPVSHVAVPGYPNLVGSTWSADISVAALLLSLARFFLRSKPWLRFTRKLSHGILFVIEYITTYPHLARLQGFNRWSVCTICVNSGQRLWWLFTLNFGRYRNHSFRRQWSAFATHKLWSGVMGFLLTLLNGLLLTFVLGYPI